jgi:hypothetical protein
MGGHGHFSYLLCTPALRNEASWGLVFCLKKNGTTMFHYWIKAAIEHIVIAKQKNKKIFYKNLKPFSEFDLTCIIPTPYQHQPTYFIDNQIIKRGGRQNNEHYTASVGSNKDI